MPTPHTNLACAVVWRGEEEKWSLCTEDDSVQIGRNSLWSFKMPYCLWATERFPQQDRSRTANVERQTLETFSDEVSCPSHSPRSVPSVGLDLAPWERQDWSLQSRLSNPKKIEIFKTADPRWPGRAEFLLWLFKSLRHPVIIASDT